MPNDLRAPATASAATATARAKVFHVARRQARRGSSQAMRTIRCGCGNCKEAVASATATSRGERVPGTLALVDVRQRHPAASALLRMSSVVHPTHGRHRCSSQPFSALCSSE